MRPGQVTRKAESEVTPAYEDAGLFKSVPIDLQLRLVPKVWQNKRADIVIQGYTGKSSQVQVVLAGRRRALADSLVPRLRNEWTIANNRGRETGVFPKLEEVQLPVRMSGVWRPQFENDGEGWQTKQYQFLVAQLWLTDREGTMLEFGEAPITEVNGDLPVGHEGPDAQPAKFGA